jgi:hypothetical protein
VGFSVTRWGNHGQTTAEGNGDHWAELVSRTVRSKDFGQSVDSFQDGRFQCGPLSGSDGVTVRAGRGGLAGGPRPREGSSHECWGAGLSAVGTTCSRPSRRTGCAGGSGGGPGFATSSRSQCRYRSLISCLSRAARQFAGRRGHVLDRGGRCGVVAIPGGGEALRRPAGGPAGGRSGGFVG